MIILLKEHLSFQRANAQKLDVGNTLFFLLKNERTFVKGSRLSVTSHLKTDVIYAQSTYCEKNQSLRGYLMRKSNLSRSKHQDVIRNA